MMKWVRAGLLVLGVLAAPAARADSFSWQGVPPGPLTNSLGANVTLNSTTTYFDGPSVAQGTVGTWFASGTVSVLDTAASGGAGFACKLWDGTTVIDSGYTVTATLNDTITMSLSGWLTNPAGNIKISCKDLSSTSGSIVFNSSGNSKDSTVSVYRIQ